MKKGYKYKLEALLKIRKLKEERCKMDIGRIQVRIRELDQEIANHNSGIDEAYELQEKSMQTGANGMEARFHPYFVEGKRAHIDGLTAQKTRLEYHVQQKFKELADLRANVKVLDKMKEKDHKSYKKNLEKKMHETIEEQVQNWRMATSKEA